MALSRGIAAKVSAYYTGWVDPEAFARSAENNLIYRQKHHVGSKPEFAFYVICEGEKELPLDLLTDPDSVRNLALVLPYNAVNLRILSLLWLIETARGPRKGENIFELEIVGDIARDDSTGEIRYGCLWFSSTIDLLNKMEGQARRKQRQLHKMREKPHWSTKAGGIPRSFNIYIKSLLKSMLGIMKKKSVTLGEVDEFTPTAKRYKVSD